MSARPAPPERDYGDGYEWVAVPDELWRAGATGRCRYTIENRKRCTHDACAKFDRSARRGRQLWWNYCAEHMYGRWIENGVVMQWVLRPLDVQETG